MKLKALILTTAFAAINLISPTANAQGMDLGKLLEESQEAMTENRWEEAFEILSRAVEFQGGNPTVHLMTVGPRFGLFHYRRGLAAMQLQKWEEALESFQICYRDYPNDPERPDNRNQMRTLSLLRSGEAALGMGDGQQALDFFKKFEQEKQPSDRYNRGKLQTDIANAHLLLGNIPEGLEQLEIAINNKVAFNTPETSIITTFQSFVSATIEAKDEQLLVDFINRNRSGLTIAPFRMHQFLEIFLKLAGDAFAADMRGAAILLYQFVPPIQLAIEDTRAVLAQMGGASGMRVGGDVLSTPRLEAALERLNTLQNSGRSPDIFKLAALAFIHENMGNLRGAYTAYQLLERNHPNADRREDNLFHLVRLSSILGENTTTTEKANLFVQTFPNSEHMPAVRRLMLSSIFFSGDYEQSIEIASAMLPTLEEGTEVHDLALFVLAGSYFYTSEYDKAKPLLDQHVELYPESEFLIPARYFQASNESRLQFWQRAGRLLDEFLNDLPSGSENPYYPSALFDRLLVHLAEDQDELALRLIDRIVNEFADNPVHEQALIVKGNILEGDGELEKATEAYEQALQLAEARNNTDIAGDAVFFLAGVNAQQIGSEENDPFAVKSVEFAERFWSEFAQGSPLQSQMAVMQMKPLGNLGRFRDGLERLQEVITEIARTPEAAGLEEAINSYTDAYLQEYSLEELREHYYNFPGIRLTDRAARALLRIAVIGAYERHAASTDDNDEKIAAEGRVRALFQELKNDFNPAELTNFILVKLGDYLRNLAAPREALVYYNEVISRSDQSYRFEALMGRADVLGSSENRDDMTRAIEDFERIFRDSQNRAQREFSLMRIVQIQLAMGDYDKAAESARRYLNRDEHNFSTYTGRVSLMLAQSFDLAGKKEDAISMYLKVWSAFQGEIRVSAPAMKRWMELNWEKNSPAEGGRAGSRQGAYEIGMQYIIQTERLKGNFTPAELVAWEEVEALVRQYEANPSIVPVER